MNHLLQIELMAFMMNVREYIMLEYGEILSIYLIICLLLQ